MVFINMMAISFLKTEWSFISNSFVRRSGISRWYIGTNLSFYGKMHFITKFMNFCLKITLSIGPDMAQIIEKVTPVLFTVYKWINDSCIPLIYLKIRMIKILKMAKINIIIDILLIDHPSFFHFVTLSILFHCIRELHISW